MRSASIGATSKPIRYLCTTPSFSHVLRRLITGTLNLAKRFTQSEGVARLSVFARSRKPRRSGRAQGPPLRSTLSFNFEDAWHTCGCWFGQIAWAGQLPSCRNRFGVRYANEFQEREIHDPGCFCHRRLSARPAAAARGHREELF